MQYHLPWTRCSATSPHPPYTENQGHVVRLYVLHLSESQRAQALLTSIMECKRLGVMKRASPASNADSLVALDQN